MKSWKTSLAGLILAVLMALQPLVMNGNFDLKRDGLRYLIAIGIAALGFLSKDHDATGVA